MLRPVEKLRLMITCRYLHSLGQHETCWSDSDRVHADAASKPHGPKQLYPAPTWFLWMDACCRNYTADALDAVIQLNPCRGTATFPWYCKACEGHRSDIEASNAKSNEVISRMRKEQISAMKVHPTHPVHREESRVCLTAPATEARHRSGRTIKNRDHRAPPESSRI
jgi:hypothetical protein